MKMKIIEGLCEKKWRNLTVKISAVISVYVGAATVGAASWWFMVYEKGPQLNYYQLVGVWLVRLSPDVSNVTY